MQLLISSQNQIQISKTITNNCKNSGQCSELLGEVMQDCTRNYLSSVFDWDSDKIMVWERPIDGGERTVRLHKPPRYFYVPDDKGTYTSITGVSLKKLEFDSDDELKANVKVHKNKFESDFGAEARVLMDEYYGIPAPKINFALLDIENDYMQSKGYATMDNPYAPINAITIYQSWTNNLLAYIVPPKSWDGNSEKLQIEIAELLVQNAPGFKADVTICRTEKDLLLYMLGDIEDADIISGWNSEFFDNPYIIKRLQRVLGKNGDHGMCFKGAPPPKEKMVSRFGTESPTYQLFGRTHLDMLDLFKKFTFEGRASYSLANISAEEIDMPKMDYDGTLEQLYNNDFPRFVAYNVVDVVCLIKIEQKFKFIQLVNQMAHENTVPFGAVLGTVRYVETGITNYAHNVHKLIVQNKNTQLVENEKVEGAIVLIPRAGLHKWIGSVDITSLYPSVIRALNMSSETFIGQFTLEEKAWKGIQNKDYNEWTAEIDGMDYSMTGKEWSEFIRLKNYALSAFGTLFDQNKPGMVADTLTYWFTERKRLQAEKKKAAKVADKLRAELGESIDGAKRTYTKAENEQIKAADAATEHFDLLQLTKKIQLNSCYGALLNEQFRWGRREIGASVTGSGRQITKFMIEQIAGGLTNKKVKLEKRYVPGIFNAVGDLVTTYDESGLVDNRIKATGAFYYNPAVLNDNDSSVFKRQHFEYIKRIRGANQKKKITEPYSKALLMSDASLLLYGLPSNPEYIDKLNKDTGIIERTPTPALYFAIHDTDEPIKVSCPEVIYGDTDSCYFSTTCDTYSDAVEVADLIAEQTNAMFPEFMSSAFNCTDGRELLISAAREVIGERALFMHAKKKYTIKVVNLDGKDLRDKPKLKSMGSEIKKADTPKVVQEFLKGLMELMLAGKKYNELEKFVNDARGSLINKNSNVLSLAPAKQVNNLDSLYAEYSRTEKVNNGKMKHCSGHVRAAINYNELVTSYDPGAKMMVAGDKAAILYLKQNSLGLKSIGFPSDMVNLPLWFTDNFEVDLSITEQKMIDSKIEGIFNAIGEDMPTFQNTHLNSVFSF
jgi:DNA polymerase elongation subunit (family B)